MPVHGQLPAYAAETSTRFTENTLLNRFSD